MISLNQNHTIMSKRIFTPDQIRELSQNPNVARCSEKSITYHKDFKLAAVKQYQEGLPPSTIFAQAGFNLAVIGRDVPGWCLDDWRRVFKGKGADGFAKETRGGPGRRKSQKHLSDSDKLKYLETQIAYLRSENAFLDKLRKQRLN